MNDVAIARTRARAYRIERFEDDHLAAARSQCARHRKTDHAGADHYTFDLIHIRPAARKPRFSIAAGYVDWNFVVERMNVLSRIGTVHGRASHAPVHSSNCTTRT
jgi:hypothetical protein